MKKNGDAKVASVFHPIPSTSSPGWLIGSRVTFVEPVSFNHTLLVVFPAATERKPGESKGEANTNKDFGVRDYTC